MTATAGVTLRLVEWEAADIALWQARLLAVRPDWFEVTARTFDDWQVRPRNIVGIVPLAGLLVRIAPKVPIASLVAMLEHVYDIDLSFHQPDASLDEVDGLLDRLARLFASRVLARLRKGIARTYVEENDDLLVVRGRVELVASARHAGRGDLRLHCAYEELTADIMDNRILLAALDCLRRTSILSDATRRVVQEGHRGLSADVTLVPVRPTDCLHRVYDRLNRDYRELHAYARLFLQHAASDLGERDVGVPFTLDMSKLFERFVAAWLAPRLPLGFRLQSQRHLAIGAAARLDSYIDLVVVDEAWHVRAVLDTKYKAAATPSREDLHQVTFYATATSCRDAFLVYPAPAVPFDLSIGNKRVRSLTFDLSQPPSLSGPAFLQSLVDALVAP